MGNRRPFGSKAFHPERTLSSLPYPRGAGQGDDGADPAPVCLGEHRDPRPPVLVVPCARSAASRQARTESAKQARRTAKVFEEDYEDRTRRVRYAYAVALCRSGYLAKAEAATVGWWIAAYRHWLG